jgi:hypothetical protein
MKPLGLSPLILLTLACGDPSGPSQTVHDQQITHDQTWHRADSPHLVKGQLTIWGGATLTIEAGVTVLFDSLSGLTLGRPGGAGTLIALGSAGAPIRMGSRYGGTVPGRWRGLRFRDSDSELHHVTLSGCGAGALSDSIPAGCISLGNPLLAGETPSLLIDHVTVDTGRGNAIALWSQSTFAPGSAVLSVHGMNGIAARMRAREAVRFPIGGSFSDNDTNEVRLSADTVADSLTLASGVPWALEGTILIEGPNEPVLTIPAGDTIRLSGSLQAGQHAPGGIRIGTIGGPTTYLKPRSSSWGGLFFLPYAVHSSVSDAVLESCGAGGGACLNLNGSYSGGPAPTPLLTNVTVRNGLGGGMAMNYLGRPAPGSTNLTITGTNDIAIFVHQSPVSAIPPGHYTGNFRSIIMINQLDVRQDETWPRFDVPKFIYNWVSVGDSVTHPTLSLTPGDSVISAAGAQIVIGEHGPGAMHAAGTALAPITFAGEANRPGSWGGIVLWFQADSSSLFDHVVVDNGGTPANVQGNFLFYTDLGPVIQNSIIRNSAGCGINIVNQPPWATDFTAPVLNNSFSGNAGGDICGP